MKLLEDEDLVCLVYYFIPECVRVCLAQCLEHNRHSTNNFRSFWMSEDQMPFRRCRMKLCHAVFFGRFLRSEYFCLNRIWLKWIQGMWFTSLTFVFSPTSSLSRVHTLFQHCSFKGNASPFYSRSTWGGLAFAVVFTLPVLCYEHNSWICLTPFQSVRWEILFSSWWI